MSNYNWSPNQNQNPNQNPNPNQNQNGNYNRNYNYNYNYQYNANGQNQAHKEHGLAHMNWAVPIIMFAIGLWPVGIILAVLKIVDASSEKNEQDARTRNWYNRVYNTNNNTSYRSQYQAWNNGRQATPGAAPMPNGQPMQPQRPQGQPMPQQQPRPQGQPMPQQRPAGAPQAAAAANAPHTAVFTGRASEEQKKTAQTHTMITAVLVVIAVIALASGIPQVLSGLSMLGIGLRASLSAVLPGLLKVAGGFGLAMAAAVRMRSRKKEKVLATITGTRNSISLKELSAASGFSPAKTLQYAKDGIQHGLYGPCSYVDIATQTLVVRGIPPKAADKQEKKADTSKGDAKYQKILADLRTANERIPGEEMTAKISKLETLSARIFDLAEKDPAKKPQLSRFMDYYLPTALKLLNTYATLDKQGMTGQNISETKANIENAMDMLIKAFEAQLDKLFQTDALDVSSDITALQSMMSMDGLTGTDFSATIGDPALDKKYQAQAEAAAKEADIPLPAAPAAPGSETSLEDLLKESSQPNLHL